MKLSFSIFLIFISVAAFGQNSLSGLITDNTTQEPLIGVSVYLPDLRQGAATDELGHFSINNLPRGRFLVQVKLIGYSPIIKTVVISGATTLDQTLTPSVTELGTVVVTGVSASTEKRRNPVPTAVVGPNELRRRAGNNIIDAIAHTPGVSQVTTGAAIAKPVIRGLSANRVVTLNNGMRQEGQQWGDEHGIEIDEYSVDRAEIVKGPGSIMYGSDAMAGVINFISPDPVEEGKITGSYSGNYQSNNGLIANSLMNAGNLNGFNWQTRLSQKAAGNYRNRYDGRVYNSGFNELNLNGYVGLNKSWGYSHLNFSSFNQNLGLTEGERDLQGNFLKLAEIDGEEQEVAVTSDDLKGYELNDPRQQVNHLRFASQNNFILGASRVTLNLDWQRNLRQEFGHDHGNHEDEHEHEHEHEHEGEAGHEDEASLIFDLQTLGYDLKYFLPEAAGWNTTFGLGGMQQTNQNRGEEFLIPEYRLADVGVFGFTRKDFGNLHLSGGLRYDRRSVDSDALYLNDHSEPTTSPAEIEQTKFIAFKRNFSNISGSVGATVDFSQKLSGKLNIARGFRAPNISELASNGRHEGTVRYEVGNPDLKPETSFQVDAGLSLDTDHITLDINGFNNNIDKYIFAEKLRSVAGSDSISDPADPAATFKYVQGDARLYGFEIGMDIHPHPLDWLHFENTFSLVRGIQLNQPDSTRNLPFIPAPRLQSEVRLNFRANSNLVRNWFTRLELEHNFRQNRIYSAYNTETTTPAYTLLNFGAGLDVPNGRKLTLLSVYLSVNNIFDMAYQNHLSRLKYTAVNEATGRRGVYNMGRNVRVKVIVPLAFRK
ncbi:TonB-dependent receptor [Adhaeribacter rhizoryzae]|uniref:TonB-dependent receptor n=1 Tax=Adhaeribacter rhizoryzae TaxID=2607907 RepID=A0A5M6DE34_9BACT|nr:TonB-dependent receptor [Adhaeribacter rhizoryzae]KAA5545653.1 TonB-dependent receptor [Adhaeribacter rhizoryzae]